MNTECPLATPVSDVVIDMVSDVESRPPEELPPLYEAIDPDVLNSLCADQPSGVERRNCTLLFDYSDSTVTVREGESVTVSRHAEA